jgi:hypothetical protein
MQEPEATRALRDVGVDVVGLVDRADILFRDAEEISFGKFLDELMNLRGGNTAKVKDILDLRKTLTQEIHQEVQKVQYALTLDRSEIQSLAAEHLQAEQAERVRQAQKASVLEKASEQRKIFSQKMEQKKALKGRSRSGSV